MSYVTYPDLKEKKILITGASRGIGKTIAENLAHNNCSIIFNYRGDESSASKLKDHLLKLGATSVTPIPFDLGNLEQMKDSVSTVLKELGSLDGLVNNAGISKDQLALRLKEEDVGQILDINLKSSIMLTSYCSRYFLKSSTASIVNVSSVVGLMGNPSQVAYSASKAGLIGLTKSYAKEMASKNIRCNAICPGFIETDMTNELSEKAKESYLETIPLKRMGKPEEIAALVSFLLSSTSSYITGEIIKIDGGLYV